MKQFTVRIPTRIDLGGGTLDIWPIYLLHSNCCTINMAIDLYIDAILVPHKSKTFSIKLNNNVQTHNLRELHSLPASGAFKLVNHIIKYFSPRYGFHLSINIATPPGSGLGTSSSLSLALCKIFLLASGQIINDHELLLLAMSLETQILQLPSGLQDYLAALYGGINAWKYDVCGWHREILPIPDKEIHKRTLLCYVGKPHDSAVSNWIIYKKRMEKNKNVTRSLENIKEAALLMLNASHTLNWKKLAAALNMEWQNRKKLSAIIQTPEMSRALSIAADNGCIAAKGCGAAQGGSILFLSKPESRQQLHTALLQEGFEVLDFHVSHEGLTWSEQQ